MDINNYKSFINKKYLPKTIFVVILFFVILFIFPPLAMIILIAYFSYVSNLIHKNFMKDYAKINKLKFSEKIDLNSFSGKLFSNGSSRRARNIIHGQYEELPIKIFNYFYSTGSGKSRRTHSFTVLEIVIEKTQFPYIFLRSKTMMRNFFNKESKISLEDEYSKHFELFCTEDYEIEVLQIFTKKLLDLLVEKGNKFSIEFSKNKIYFYDDLVIRNKKQLDELYNVVKKVIEKTGPLLHRLHDDFDAMHNSYN